MPDYCSGMAYLMTPDLAAEFVKASKEVMISWQCGQKIIKSSKEGRNPSQHETNLQVPRFPLDDVYVLGFIRRHLGVHPSYLNLRYAYEQQVRTIPTCVNDILVTLIIQADGSQMAE